MKSHPALFAALFLIVSQLASSPAQAANPVQLTEDMMFFEVCYRSPHTGDETCQQEDIRNFADPAKYHAWRIRNAQITDGLATGGDAGEMLNQERLPLWYEAAFERMKEALVSDHHSARIAEGTNFTQRRIVYSK